jgi:hypothetical protein
MIRLTWRLARPNIISSAALLAAVVVYAALTRSAMSSYLDDSGFTACMAAGGDCADITRGFGQKFDTVINSYTWINLVPLLIGVFWGAPLVAREIEQGTHRLAWTQSISRGRWLAARLGIFVLGALLVAAALTQVMTWWFTPIENLRIPSGSLFGRLDPNVFDFRGTVPVAYTLFAFAVGVTAGTFIRRTVPAIALTLAAYIPVKIGIQELRGHYFAPLTRTYPFDEVSPSVARGDWIIEQVVVDRAGSAVDLSSVPDVCADQAAADNCLAAQGYRFVETYQPADRFWPFQLIESGIFIGLSAVLLGLAAWWIIRRVA